MKPRDSAVQRPIDILLVDDNPGDVRLIMEALKNCEVPNHTTVVGNGVDALAFLQRTGKHSNASRPDLILLDLNLPKMNGHEILAKIKTNSDLKKIPVVIFTSSKADEDIFKSYDLHTNYYVAKPVDLDQFNEKIQDIMEFWYATARPPKK